MQCLMKFQDTSMIDVGKFISKDSVANITQFQFIKDKSRRMQVTFTENKIYFIFLCHKLE